LEITENRKASHKIITIKDDSKINGGFYAADFNCVWRIKKINIKLEKRR